MTPGHSTLELVKHDETATAPERDNDATAFELDTSRIAPEVDICRPLFLCEWTKLAFRS